MPASVKCFGVILSALVSALYAQSTSEADQVSRLRLAPTEVDRIKLLANSDVVFNFLAPPSGVISGSGGHTVAATSENFPALVGNGVSMSVGFLGPCGMNSPHTHPRATEMSYSLNTTLRAGVLVEDGARFIQLDITPGKAALFPQGSIHYEMNPTCEPAMFVSGFNNEDPGVSQVAQRYFGLPPDIISASFGGLDIVEVAGLESTIPDDVIYGVEECLQRCGTQSGEQPTDQRKPQNPASSIPIATESLAIPSQTVLKVSFMDLMTSSPQAQITPVLNDDDADPEFENGSNYGLGYFYVDVYSNPLITALVALNIAVFFAVTVGIAFLLLGTRRRELVSSYRPYMIPGMVYTKAHAYALDSGETTAYHDSPMPSPRKV